MFKKVSVLIMRALITATLAVTFVLTNANHLPAGSITEIVEVDSLPELVEKVQKIVASANHLPAGSRTSTSVSINTTAPVPSIEIVNVGLDHQCIMHFKNVLHAQSFYNHLVEGCKAQIVGSYSPSKYYAFDRNVKVRILLNNTQRGETVMSDIEMVLIKGQPVKINELRGDGLVMITPIQSNWVITAPAQSSD